MLDLKHCCRGIWDMILGLFVVMTTACVSGPEVRVVDRAPGFEETPAWVGKSFYEEKEQVYFSGSFEAKGSANKLAAIEGARVQALGKPFVGIVHDYISQSGAAVELEHDVTAVKSVTALLRNYIPPMPGMHVLEEYWQLKDIKGTNSLQSRLEAYVLVSMPKADYERAKQDAMEKLQNNAKLKAELDDALRRQRERAHARPNASDESDGSDDAGSESF